MRAIPIIKKGEITVPGVGNDKSIILLTFNNDSHFEIIGKTVSVDADKKHKIKREFMPFDDIIKSINFYLDKKDREIK